MLEGINEKTIPLLVVLVILIGAASYFMVPIMFPSEAAEEKVPEQIVEPIDPCIGKVCNDDNPCTRDYCLDGICRFDVRMDGYPCGLNKVCEKGTCVELVEEKEELVVPTQPKEEKAIESINVTHNTHNQYEPHLYKNTLLWTDTRNGNKDIYQYKIDTGTTTRITNHKADQEEACSNDRGIVWTDNRHGDKDIYYLDFEEERVYNVTRGEMGGITRESDMPGRFRLPHGSEKNQQEPYLFDNKIVWSDEKYEKKFIPSITLFDLDTRTFRRLMSNPKKEDQPSMWDNTIVWRVFNYGRTATIADIFAFDLVENKGQVIIATSLHESEPFVNDGKIVYLEGVSSNSQVMVYDMKTKETRRITTGEDFTHTRPKIEGNIVAYSKKVGEQWDIYVYDLDKPKEYRVTFTENNETSPVMDGDYLAWVGGEFDDKDIYLLNLTQWLKTQ